MEREKVKGLVGEMRVSQFLESRGYSVKKLTDWEHREFGYDLHCQSPTHTLLVEVKTEHKADLTGNIFIEMEAHGKPGWFFLDYPSEAFILWYLPISDTIYALPAPRLAEIPVEACPKRTLHRLGSEGHLVPLELMNEYWMRWA
jgi:hypothetical protein